MRPDLVIFDCDGVLVDSEMLSSEVLIASLAALGVVITPDYVRRHFLGRSFPTVAQLIRDDFAVTLPQDFEPQYRRRLLARFETELHPTPGVEAVLRALAVPACVATSSSPPRVRRTLEITGLGRYFGKAVFTASQVARGKPAPDLFLFAARAMGADPARVLVIEDSLPGIDAARAAGMTVRLYTGGAHMRGRVPAAAGPVAAFDSWASFPQECLTVSTAKGRP